jgi:HEAT repeat protein
LRGSLITGSIGDTCGACCTAMPLENASACRWEHQMPWWKYEPTTPRGHANRLAEDGRWEELLEGLKSDSRAVRRATVWAMRGVKREGGTAFLNARTDPRFFDVFCEFARSDPDPTVRRMAFMGLAFSDDDAAIPILLSALDDSDEAVRGWAVIGLGNLRSREAVDRLIPMICPYRRSTVTVVDALVKMRNERAIQPLRDAASATRLPWRRRRLNNAADKLARSVGLVPWD